MKERVEGFSELSKYAVLKRKQIYAERTGGEFPQELLEEMRMLDDILAEKIPGWRKPKEPEVTGIKTVPTKVDMGHTWD